MGKDNTRPFPIPYSTPPLLAWREGKHHGPDHEPDRREQPPVAEEASEIHVSNPGDDHVPEWRGQVAHMIPYAHRQDASLNRDAYLHRRFRSNEALDRPLAPARRDEDREDRADDRRQQRERQRR